jgi:hypothetical protein
MLLLAVVGCGSGSQETAMGETTSEEATGTTSEETPNECPEVVWTGEFNVSLHVKSVEEAETLPRYTRIEGGLVLHEVPGIANLSFLECLEELTGDLVLTSLPDLENVDGLEHLTTVAPDDFPGRIVIRDNPKLSSLDGLSNLVSLDTLSIEGNPLLTSLEPLESLEFAEDIDIWGNDALETIGLRNLQLAEKIRIGSGYCNAPSTEVFPPVGNASLVEIDGFDSLKTFEVLAFWGNPSLVSIDGLLGLGNTDGERRISVGFNGSLSYAHILEVQSALGLEFHSICSNLDDPEMCTCP